MAIKTSGSLLQRDVSKESSRLGAQAAGLAKAKSGGAGIGGLLGAIAGVALAPFTGGASLLMAGIGGGSGALAGSKIGGAAAGGQESLLEGGKFLQGSRHQMATDIAAQEGMDIAMAAATGAFNAGGISKGVEAFKAGGIKGLGSALIPGVKEATVGSAAEGALSGAKGSILDVVKQASIPGPGKITGGIAKAGVGKVIGNLFSGGNKNQTSSPSYGDSDGLLGAIPDMDGGMGSVLGKLFPGMDEESAASSMGMSLDEFYKYLQQASDSGVGG